jgi:putative restriction endonuclease
VPVVEGKARPYADEIGPDGLMRYKYRGKDPMHRDNAGLRLAMQRHIPLVYFYGLIPGKYAAIWPVYIVGDDPKTLAFSTDKVNLSSTAFLFSSPPPFPGSVSYVRRFLILD